MSNEWNNIEEKLPKYAGLYECKTKAILDGKTNIVEMGYATLYKCFNVGDSDSYDNSIYFYSSNYFRGTDVDGKSKGLFITHWRQKELLKAFL